MCAWNVHKHIIGMYKILLTRFSFALAKIWQLFFQHFGSMQVYTFIRECIADIIIIMHMYLCIVHFNNSRSYYIYYMHGESGGKHGDVPSYYN